jgi:hypothetical protein
MYLLNRCAGCELPALASHALSALLWCTYHPKHSWMCGSAYNTIFVDKINSCACPVWLALNFIM